MPRSPKTKGTNTDAFTRAFFTKECDCLKWYRESLKRCPFCQRVNLDAIQVKERMQIHVQGEPVRKFDENGRG